MILMHWQSGPLTAGIHNGDISIGAAFNVDISSSSGGEKISMSNIDRCRCKPLAVLVPRK